MIKRTEHINNDKTMRVKRWAIGRLALTITTASTKKVDSWSISLIWDDARELELTSNHWNHAHQQP